MARRGVSRLLETGASCFESLVLRQAQQNGIFSIISNPFPFVLSSLSKGSERVFQRSAREAFGQQNIGGDTYGNV
jgi:hypothetical protein